MYPTQEAAELAALTVREDPTLRDLVEDEPTILRMPLEAFAAGALATPAAPVAAVADDGRDRHPRPPTSGPPVSGPPVNGPPVNGPPVNGPPVSGPPTVKLPISALAVDLAQQAALARGSSRGPGPARGRIGKYELRERLGRGAFGVVYTARDPSLDRDVAIKVLRPNHLRNPTIVQRFLQEARASARIAHPGIVTIHDCGQVETKVGPTAFIAMELLFGESLTARLNRAGRLPADAASEIIRQVASALDAAHRADVLHRDLKPDNIYLVPDPAIPSGERVKVLDFGLAKLGHDGETNVETVFGTPHYMSPEQCRSATQVDHRSDIYSLGCILYELVTGHVPFEGEVRELIEFHQFVAPPRASSIVPDLPPELDALIAEMLSKDPMHRPQTMGAVRRALQRGESGPQRIDSGPQRAPSAPALAAPIPELPRTDPASGPSAVPLAIVDDAALSGVLLVPPSGERAVIVGEKRSAPTAPPRWRRIGARARLVGFTLTLAVVSALIAWACTG
jgi:serine/threonine protein kinase